MQPIPLRLKARVASMGPLTQVIRIQPVHLSLMLVSYRPRQQLLRTKHLTTRMELRNLSLATAQHQQLLARQQLLGGHQQLFGGMKQGIQQSSRKVRDEQTSNIPISYFFACTSGFPTPRVASGLCLFDLTVYLLLMLLIRLILLSMKLEQTILHLELQSQYLKGTVHQISFLAKLTKIQKGSYALRKQKIERNKKLSRKLKGMLLNDLR